MALFLLCPPPPPEHGINDACARTPERSESVMDFVDALAEFVDELLGHRGEYGLHELGDLDDAAEAAALMRLRLRIADTFLADGWRPSNEAALDADRQRLEDRPRDDPEPRPSTAQERATLRARTAEVRAASAATRGDSVRTREHAEDLRREVEQMREAIRSRAVIEQAKGITMERYGLPADVAWSFLVRTSQQRNKKLRVIAEELVGSAAEREPATSE